MSKYVLQKKKINQNKGPTIFSPSCGEEVVSIANWNVKSEINVHP